MLMTTNEILQKLGLNDKEIKVYLTLLRHGKMKPAVIADLTKVSRPLVYNAASTLLSMGLITEDVSGKTLTYIALPPKDLERLIEEAKRDAKEKEVLIKEAIGKLSLISAGKQYPVPKIRLVEEPDLEKFLFDNISKWQDEVISSDGVWWGFQDNQFVDRFPKWIEASWQTKQSEHSNYKAQVLTNISPTEQKLGKKYTKQKRDMAYIDQSNFTATTWVCGDYLVMIMIKEHPYYLLEIHDKLMARNTAEIFKRLWEKSSG
jgi:sugar-specific transcriptional regulator TrmB